MGHFELVDAEQWRDSRYGGNDVLCGGSGADELIGGSGADLLWGGTGRDTLLAQDGTRDQYLNCGGAKDRVVLDSGLDPRSRLCP